MNSLLFSLVVLASVLAVSQGVTVTCVDCVSILGLNPDCEADPFDPTASGSDDNITCDGYCTKDFSKIDGTITAMTRTCSATCDDPGCTSFFGLSGCNHCCNDGDLCNSATFVSLSHAAMFISSATVMVLSVLRL